LYKCALSREVVSKPSSCTKWVQWSVVISDLNRDPDNDPQSDPIRDPESDPVC